ncbi:hypothetical protein RchiOBHm_Chr0c04g0497911 [Rosa chinensis]|uniref:Uncharacterized protein n=1 Tax=Rosa chinensis TaxID=74649 RepID=A0A2P6SQU7_ROSCH|nr:hypothetical protein RchiOBHm_Chr0c04g0497911 [Rosa chinensis]
MELGFCDEMEIFLGIKSDFAMGNHEDNVKNQEEIKEKRWKYYRESFKGLCNKKKLKTSPNSLLNPLNIFWTKMRNKICILS